MAVVRRGWWAAGLLALAGLIVPAPAGACPFCMEEKGKTLVGDFNEASLVLLGTFSNFRPGAGDDALGGKTDFRIADVLKPHPALKTAARGNTLVLDRGVPATKSQFVIFCDVYKDKIDPYRGVEVPPGSDLVSYLKKALTLKDRPLAERLRLCFDYLNSPDLDVALDAYREFAKADYKEYRELSKSLPADRIAQWLQDPKTPPYRYGLYASLLGHCGDPQKHGKLLRSLIDDPEKRRGSGIDGMLAAYVMLQPKEGWAYLQNLLKDGQQDFLLRYAGLRTARFLWAERPDLVPRTDLVAGVSTVLDHPDMADFAIEDLRKWQRWEAADRVLDLFTKESHNVPVIRRAVLRYALQCPGKRAAAFVAEQRRRDPEWVNDAEELLRAETEAPPAQEKKK
jgi:hypothetical protein